MPSYFIRCPQNSAHLPASVAFKCSSADLEALVPLLRSLWSRAVQIFAILDCSSGRMLVELRTDTPFPPAGLRSLLNMLPDAAPVAATLRPGPLFTVQEGSAPSPRQPPTPRPT